MKKIGITTNIVKEVAYLDNDYIKYVKKANALPVLIPNVHSGNYDKYIDEIDALIITGGEDISPFIFNQDPHYSIGKYSNLRDTMETELYFKAREKGMKILGICRGHQLINAVEGGSLYQDMSLIKNSFVIHTHPDKPYSLEHYINIRKNSILYDIFKETKIIVNSHHHQAIDRIAKGFSVTAKANDNVVEAIESDDKLVLNVQFHPERLLHRDKFIDIIKWLCEG